MSLSRNLLGAALAAASLLSSGTAQCVVGGTTSPGQCFTLYAGQTIAAGSVCVFVESNALKVTYSTTGGWELTEAHLWISNSITEMPQTKSGNPIPGKYPFKSGDISGLTSYTFAIPLSNPLINFSCPGPDVTYLMAAHAAVRKADGLGGWQTETGWSDGSPVTSRGNWAMFSTFALSCSCGGGGSKSECETAFARHGSANTCFLDLGFDRWGWTNGPVGPGTYVMDLWAGAGQCDLTKGALVGTVTMVYDGSTATVTYATTGGWWMSETQLYVGNARLPLQKQGRSLVETVAPGQYPYKHSDINAVTTDTYSVAVTGNVYLVAHAVTCHHVQ